ncbi:uncharacterized protein LOC129589964 [Paramacrobiotus metropolitanus]|uniref:uncharacterized protein LOC129589964 n=1 Tax=Paramacrobiotus metropolitanus TaxID=2943436 RepID=UPI002445B89C|nr:uncharacterized protein LOC129589964 [Paramacrobiotus metropolitanus]
MFWLTEFKTRWPLLYTVVDRFLVFFVLFPSVVAYWASIWAVLDYLLADLPIEPLIWGYIVAGVFVLVALNCFQYDLKEHFQEPHGNVVNIIVKRVYTAVAGCGNLFLWKGVWWAQDYYSGTSVASAVFSIVIGVILLILLRCSCNGIAVPLGTAFDEHEQFFIIPTRFQKKNDERCLLLLDSLFSVAVVGSLVVFEWRGIWLLQDLLVYPNNKDISVILSVLIGYYVAIMVDMAQKPAASFSAYLEKHYGWWSKLVFEDLYLLLAKICVLAAWRGLWVACEMWIRTPEYAVLLDRSLILCVVSYIIPTVLLHANSFFILEVQIDGGMADGAGCKVKCTVLNHYVEFWDPESRKARGKRREKEKVAMLSPMSSTESTATSSGASSGQNDVSPDKIPIP